jgi:membrane-bound inhibitor of C-type lysozyme
MTKNRYNIPFLILITLIAIGTVVYLKIKKPEAFTLPTPEITFDPKVYYSCTEGTIEALYKDSSVTLILSDRRILSLSEKTAASGLRFEYENTVFVSKGSDAFLEENGKRTYNNCVENSAPAAASSDRNVFVDNGKMFSFSYPKDLVVSGGELGYTSSWRANTQTLGLTLAKVVLPKTSQPNTNLSDSWFTVGTSSDTTAVKNCLVAENGEQAKGTTTINGVQYATFVLGDAGAGNYYDTTSYRTVRNSQCYAVEYTIHSTSLGAYSPDQGIKQFDLPLVTTLFESLVRSVTFL